MFIEKDKNLEIPIKMGSPAFFSWKNDSFQKSKNSKTFVPLWCPNFMQKLNKTNKQSLGYVKIYSLKDH